MEPILEALTLYTHSSGDVAPTLWAEQANPNPRFMLIRVRRSCWTFQDRRRQMRSACYHLEGGGVAGPASVFVVGQVEHLAVTMALVNGRLVHTATMPTLFVTPLA